MTEYSRSERRQSRHRKKPTPKESKQKSSFLRENQHLAIQPDSEALKGRSARIKVPVGFLLLLSFLFSFFSAANPIFIDFADSVQSQFLYAGKAMLAGQVPYTDFYASSGLIYYFIGGLGNLLSSSWLLMFFQVIALYFAGSGFYKTIVYLSGQRAVGQQLIGVFYLLLGVMGFGGLYATLFALPFIMNALWHLIRYFSGNLSDEAFIWYGINGGVVFLIDPKSFLVWLLAGLVLLVYNIRTGQKARGFYQALGTFFGFSLLVYSLGYYTVLNKNFGPAIQQTFLYQLEELSFSHAGGLQNMLLALLFLLGTGLLTSLFYGVLAVKRGGDRDFKVLLYLLFLLYLAESLASPHFSAASLLILVPFGLLLTGAHMGNPSVFAKGIKGQVDYDNDQVTKSYFALNGFLPVLALVYLLAYPAWTFLTSGQERADRQTAAAYIQDKAAADTRVYAWDDSALVYLKSQRWSSAEITTPDTYLTNSDNRDDLTLTLTRDKTKFILVNHSEEVPAELTKHLTDNYQTVDLDLKNFTLYQLK